MSTRYNLTTLTLVFRGSRAGLGPLKDPSSNASALWNDVKLLRQKIWKRPRLSSKCQEPSSLGDFSLEATKARLLEIEADRGQVAVLQRKSDEIDAKRLTLQTLIDRQYLDIEDRKVKSPINGVVDKVFIDQGEYVRQGQRIALIHNPKNVWVETNVRKRYVT